MRLSLIATLGSLPLGLSAHPGHGTFSGNELAHYFTSAEHAVPVLILAVALIVALVHFTRVWREQHTGK
ncbi:MAG: hypothetical protein H6555_04865 [Lewinellaceae bacterium]|nr:hypothetical protein [Lewinellaceae bacterium]